MPRLEDKLGRRRSPLVARPQDRAERPLLPDASVAGNKATAANGFQS